MGGSVLNRGPGGRRETALGLDPGGGKSQSYGAERLLERNDSWMIKWIISL